ncbi:MAG: ABC transporter substrate-binding protein [Alphaproteobacteria bacterium]|jgi:spermidine/putrescine-binding protein|nr:ABC transporter substrate-binding protein [Alphaproteobacteria bacterium]
MMTMKDKLGSAVAVAALAVAGFAGAAHADGELNMLTWEGYTDPSFVAVFEEQSGCKVTPTYVGSNDEFPAKLAGGGGVYDLVSPSVDTTTILMKAGLVEAIDTSRIEGWGDIFPQFSSHSGVNYEGGVYGVPYTWGAIPFMYRVDSFDAAPTSIAQMWGDENMAGKISLWDDKTNIYVVARMLYGNDIDVYDLNDEQLAAVRDKLIELKPAIRKYWSTAGELVNLYANGEVIISNTWGGYQSALLADEGIEMIEFIPTENADGWADAWQIVAGSPNLDCAYEWLNFTVSADGQCGVVGITGYSGSNPSALATCKTDEEMMMLHMDDFSYLDSLVLWQEPARVDAYINTWNAVKAAQ